MYSNVTDFTRSYNYVSEESNIWLENQIKPLKRLNQKEILFSDNKLEFICPKTLKQKYILTLSNGFKFETSKDHKIAVLKNRSKKFQFLAVEDIINDTENKYYIKIPKHVNNNTDQIWQGKVIKDDMCYQLGLAYVSKAYKLNKDIKFDTGFKI